MKRKLGRSGIEVSAMGMGCWAIGGPFWRENEAGERSPMGWGNVDEEESIRTIHAAIDLGVNLFDTSNNYGAGTSEKVLAKALKGKRDQIILATKFGSNFDEEANTHYDHDAEPVITAAFLKDAVEGSLRRLETDRIDLYQLHRSSYDLELVEDLVGLLEDLVAEGKIRWYGWSTNHLDRAEAISRGTHCTAIQATHNVFMPASEMLELTEANNLACINKHPLLSGSLTGKFNPDTTFPENDLRHGIDWRSGRGQRRLKQVDAVQEILTSEGRTMAQGALAWIWATSPTTIPIPGAKNAAQTTENAGAMQFGPLEQPQVDEITEILKEFEENE